MDIYLFLMEYISTEVLNSNDGMTNLILNYVNGQVIVLTLMLLNWSEAVSNKRLKPKIKNHNVN